MKLEWADGLFPYKPGPRVPEPWQGTLIGQKQDASGLMYRRNRYYDPATGRFTQEDPIGLAGGVNMYGFAAGDPVSYSDPYGPIPCTLPHLNVEECKQAIVLAMAEGALAGFGIIADALGARELGEAATG